jgi:hypothetical protein
MDQCTELPDLPDMIIGALWDTHPTVKRERILLFSETCIHEFIYYPESINGTKMIYFGATAISSAKPVAFVDGKVICHVCHFAYPVDEFTSI